MAHPRLRLRTSNCSLLLVYLPRKDERLSGPGWLTYSGWFTHTSASFHSLCCVMNRKVNPVFLCKQCVVSDTRQPQVERRTAKVCLSETDVLPLCHATNLQSNDFLQVVNRHHSSKLISFFRISRFCILASRSKMADLCHIGF